MHRKILGNAARAAAFVVLLLLSAAFLLFFMGPDAFQRLLSIEPLYIAIIFLLCGLSIFFGGLEIKLLAGLFGVKLGFREWFCLPAITGFANYLTPFRGGMLAKAVYLKKKHRLPYTAFVAIEGATYIIAFLLFSTIGLLLSAFLLLTGNAMPVQLMVFFLILLAAALLFLLFLPRAGHTRYRLLNHIINSINELERLRKNPAVTAKVAGVHFMILLIMALRLYFAFLALQFNVPFFSCLVMGLLAEIGMLITITPASLGIKEALIVFSAPLVAVGLDAGALAAALDRIIAMSFVFAVGPLFSFILIKEVKAE